MTKVKVKEIKKQVYNNAVNQILEFAKSELPVPIEEIPEVFKEDFNNFMAGESVMKNHQGQFCARVGDFIRWTKKIVYKGFDYPIRLLTDE